MGQLPVTNSLYQKLIADQTMSVDFKIDYDSVLHLDVCNIPSQLNAPLSYLLVGQLPVANVSQ